AAPVLERPVRRSARETDEVARHDRLLADLVGDEHGFRRAAVARTARLIDVGVMSDRALEPLRVPEPGLAHDPRDERGRPGVPPAGHEPSGRTPVGVVPLDNPAALRGDGPVAGDRWSDASGLPRTLLENLAQA